MSLEPAVPEVSRCLMRGCSWVWGQKSWILQQCSLWDSPCLNCTQKSFAPFLSCYNMQTKSKHTLSQQLKRFRFCQAFPLPPNQGHGQFKHQCTVNEEMQKKGLAPCTNQMHGRVTVWQGHIMAPSWHDLLVSLHLFGADLEINSSINMLHTHSS